jgi:hypothetical protein
MMTAPLLCWHRAWLGRRCNTASTSGFGDEDEEALGQELPDLGSSGSSGSSSELLP